VDGWVKVLCTTYIAKWKWTKSGWYAFMRVIQYYIMREHWHSGWERINNYVEIFGKISNFVSCKTSFQLILSMIVDMWWSHKELWWCQTYNFEWKRSFARSCQVMNMRCKVLWKTSVHELYCKTCIKNSRVLQMFKMCRCSLSEKLSNSTRHQVIYHKHLQ
jgi:hypothetical protein